MNSSVSGFFRNLSVVAVCVCGLLPLQLNASSQLIENSVFTSQLIDAEPADILDAAYLSAGNIFIYLKWQDLESRLYDVENFIYDGENRLVGHSTYGFKPSNARWRSWTKYQFRSNIDSPGDWRFVVKLDGEKILERTIYVSH
ncbi:hypothetical protein A9Q99_15090 [Gammaproteobacteria bacterium 45_16_T64]|nr:hypothetical protein A9Q99_15090 [Gammaproteobacteria bacterium 45_16_T64]